MRGDVSFFIMSFLLSHTQIHRHIHTYIHTYIHAYIHTYIHSLIRSLTHSLTSASLMSLKKYIHFILSFLNFIFSFSHSLLCLNKAKTKVVLLFKSRSRRSLLLVFLSPHEFASPPSFHEPASGDAV